MVKKYHENVLVYSTGFYINAKYPHLGASTGDMIICDCRGKGLLEIKCPHKYHNGLKVWKDVKIFHLMNQIKKDCVYYAQVQGQLLILDINFLCLFYLESMSEYNCCKYIMCLYNKLKKYCICNRPCFEPILACDRPNFKVEWYHYACVKLTRAPKASWICPPCLIEVSTQSCSEK